MTTRTKTKRNVRLFHVGRKGKSSHTLRQTVKSFTVWQRIFNGRNSLIFTWNKQQRVIHEEDLLHHYDPNQRRQKVEDQPCRRMGQIEAKTPPPLRSIEVIPSFGRCYSTLGERQYELKLPLNPKSSPHHLKGKSSAADPGDTIPRRTPSCCLPEKFRSLRRDILSER